MLKAALGEKLRQRIEDLEAIAASASPSQVAGAEIGDAPSPRTSETTTTTRPDAAASKQGPSSYCASLPRIAADEGLSGRGEAGGSTPVAVDSLSPDSWDPVVYLDPSLLVGHSPASGPGLAWMPARGCGCSRPDDGLQRIVSHRGGAQKPSGGAGWSDPYANHLRLETVCTLDAMFGLGALLGIPRERMCPPETQSPFFRPGIDSPSSSSSSADAIRTVQQIFRTLKPDLRPGREQVAVAHHPFIDCLPFPTLRRNLLVHGAHIDAEQLQLDVVEGLVCWGGAGISRRDSKDAAGGAPTGTPWDVRSWEAKEGFLLKYWTMLGGEDGELVRQSEWWRGIRGEEPLCIELMS